MSKPWVTCTVDGRMIMVSASGRSLRSNWERTPIGLIRMVGSRHDRDNERKWRADLGVPGEPGHVTLYGRTRHGVVLQVRDLLPDEPEGVDW